MLKTNNTKHKIGVGLAATSLASLSILGLLTLTYTPNYARAIEDPRTMGDIEYMQDITPTICTNSELNKQYTLKDKRVTNSSEPGYQYTVAKLKDGNCWMTQNLAIINKNISSEDSDMDSGAFTIPASNISGFRTADINELKAYYDARYGGYYNWITATAGSVAVPGNATKSICPKGWRLPTGGTNTGDFYTLLNGLSVSAIMAAPYNFVASGSIYAGAIDNAEAQGRFLTSTLANDDKLQPYMLYFSIYSGSLAPSSTGNFYRHDGTPMRCVNSSIRYNDDPYIPPLGENQAHGNINVTIPSILTVEASSNVSGDITPAVIKEGTIIATVDANIDYNISLSSDKPNLTISNDVPTPNIPASSNVSPNTNGWGIKNNNNTYSAITTTPSPYYNTLTTNSLGSNIHTYGVGISISPSLPAGTYSTNVTITVSPK